MRNVLCVLLLLVSISFAQNPNKYEGESVADTSALMLDSPEYKLKSFCGGLLVDVSAGTHWADYNVSIAYGREIWKNLFFTADAMNFHIITDIEDSTSRISAISTLISAGFFLPELFTQSETLAKIWYVVTGILNPTLEYDLWRGKMGASLSVGYKTDWFAFSSDHALYFKPHAEINIDVFIFRISASYAYVVTDTYDIKRGSRFYLKTGFVFYGD